MHAASYVTMTQPTYPVSTVAQVYTDKLLSSKMPINVFLSFVFNSSGKNKVPLQLTMFRLYRKWSRSTTHCQHRVDRRWIPAAMQHSHTTQNIRSVIVSVNRISLKKLNYEISRQQKRTGIYSVKWIYEISTEQCGQYSKWQKMYEIKHTTTTTHHNRFTAFFPEPPGWAGARRELLDFMVHAKINRGRHTDHPAGRHSIWTNQCLPPPSPHIFYRPDALPAAQPTVPKHWRQHIRIREKMHRLQICPIVHNWRAPSTTPPSYIRVRAVPVVWECSEGLTDRYTDGRGQYTFRLGYASGKT